MASKNKAEEIFNKAVELSDAAERAAYLDEACGGDDKLRAEVDALLGWHQEAGSFLEVPAMDPNVTLETSASGEGPGAVIGRYKLLEKVGEGGMATVYMAEQKRPIRRRVALKIIKLGMDTKQVIARFEAERQALAMMDHPNIAQVFDAGTTEAGRPYFVMELVRGVPITQFCDRNHLSPRERLELFISVCQAVQHAHQKGIIHRDIKPTNIMVTLHDGKAVVKVIDFGIAKAVNQQLTEKTVFTRYSQMIGTPEYMSPEQAEMSGLDIDTRTDVFSLGVLLYELLTGATPFDSEYLLSKGYGEMQRIIREEEPTRPSTKLSTLGEALTEIAEHRRTSPELLCKLMRTDLDWIVMKTLEKDRSRRYESVSELAADIKRHLHSEPVLAGRPNAVYRLQKYIRRNKVLVTSVATIAAVVLVAAILSVVLAIKARKAEEEAVRASAAETKQRQDAEEARNAAEDLAERQKEDLYFNYINLAHQELRGNRPAHALDYLDKCPEGLRNWEWYYLQRRSFVQSTSTLEFDEDIHSFCVSPNGSKVAAYSSAGRLMVQDQAGEPRYSYSACPSLDAFDPDSENIFWRLVTFCPDGQYIAAVADNHIVALISVVSGEVVKRFKGHRAPVTWIDFSPNGRLVATASRDNTVRIWDRTSGKELERLNFDSQPANLAFSASGKWLIIGMEIKLVKKYNVEDVLRGTKEPRETSEIGYDSTDITISPDGRHMARALWSEDAVLLSDGDYNDIRRLPGHTSFVSSVAFNADGTRLASTGLDQTIRLWDVKTGRQVLEIEEDDLFSLGLAFSSDDHRLYVGNLTNTLKVLDASPLVREKTANPIVLQGRGDLMTCVEYSPSGQYLLSSGWDPEIRLWDAVDGQQVSRVGEEIDKCACITFSNDGNWIAAKTIHQGQSVVKVWQAMPPHRERFSLKLNSVGIGIAFSSDDQYLIVSMMDGTLCIYDWRKHQAIGELGQGDPQHAFVVSVVASGDGKHLASTDFYGTVKIWDATRLLEQQEGRLVYDGGFGFFWVDFSPDNEHLAVGGREGTIKILNVESGETAAEIENAHGGKISCVSYSPNGRYLASCGSDRTVRIWETTTLRSVEVLMGHKGRVMHVNFSPDGRQLASAGKDGTVRIWTPRVH